MLGTTFGRSQDWPLRDLIGYSDEFDAAIALEAYRCGVFPMPLNAREMGWWSPMQRGLLPVHGLRVTRSLGKTVKRYTTTTDTAFDDVLTRCADPKREGSWIDARIASAYRRLAETGWAHSVEVWNPDGDLVGGLYGVQVGGLFAGESMFHHPELGRDASKAALLRLVLELDASGVTLLDVQWLTEHLGSLGAYEVPREQYLRRLSVVAGLPTRPWVERPPMTGADVLSAWRGMRDRHSLAGRLG